jgi:hypothetical protein
MALTTSIQCTVCRVRPEVCYAHYLAIKRGEDIKVLEDDEEGTLRVKLTMAKMVEIEAFTLV